MVNDQVQLIFLDNLNFSSFIFLIKKRLSEDIYSLDKLSLTGRFFSFLLKMRGYNIHEASFFSGHLKTKQGESVYMASSDKARKIAVAAAEDILRTTPYLFEINNYFGRNTLHLHLTKQLVWYIRFWCERIMVSQVLAGTKEYSVCMKSPNRINNLLISQAFPSSKILYYYPTLVSFWFHCKQVSILIRELVRLKVFPFNGSRKRFKQVKQNLDEPAVLMLQEDSMRSDASLRGQPHWYDFQAPNKGYKTYTIKSKLDSSIMDLDTEENFKKHNIYTSETLAFKNAFVRMRKHESLKIVREWKYKLLKSIALASGFKSKYFIIRTALFLKQAEFMGTVVLWTNAKVFLFRETYIPLTDAIQLASKDLGIRTIAYQYSNLGVNSPIMMNTADLMLVFSDQFKNIFSNKYFSPASYLTTGYIYDGITNVVSGKAFEMRNKLMLAGVEFIICFCDESVQDNRWGMISKEDHLHELHILAEAVIFDPSIAVIVKSQFQKNTPSMLYPDDELISTAVLSGRFVEMHTGTIRNDIYPTEAALVADITIGHKFGATASLEAAIAGVRSVMLDSYGIKTIWDEFYNNSLITFESIEILMNAIHHFRIHDEKYQLLGDWSPFLDNFTVNKDGSSIKKMRELVEEECLNNR